MAENAQREPVDLTDFFSAAEARTDRWRQLSAIARAWESVVAGAQLDKAATMDT